MKWVSIDMKGQKYGRLTVLERAGTNSQVLATWVAQCDCGTVGVYVGRSIRDGHTRSCGCLQRELLAERSRRSVKKPRQKLPPEYAIWQGIKDRCHNPNNPAYKNYGGRGIEVCAQWRNDYKQFVSDMGFRPDPLLTLDRIDNNKGYSPENCRWASRKDQCRNKRNNRKVIRDDGMVFNTIAEAAESVGGGMGNIGSVCAGRQKSAYGHTWKYMEESE